MPAAHIARFKLGLLICSLLLPPLLLSLLRRRRTAGERNARASQQAFQQAYVLGLTFDLAACIIK